MAIVGIIKGYCAKVRKINILTFGDGHTFWDKQKCNFEPIITGWKEHNVFAN